MHADGNGLRLYRTLSSLAPADVPSFTMYTSSLVWRRVLMQHDFSTDALAFSTKYIPPPTISNGISATVINNEVQNESQNDAEPRPTRHSANRVINKDIHQCSKGQECNSKDGQKLRIMECDCDPIGEQPYKDPRQAGKSYRA